MNINKATHEPFNTELFAPIIKETKGNYLAVLSDTSMDRDGERVGKSAFQNSDILSGYTAGLIDHENKVLNQVCCWENKRIVDIDGHTALVAEPKFFLSNPNAAAIKGMLDEGAEIGISIGAIVKQYEDQKVSGKSIRTFTELELLEASFVAIPSNKHGRAMAVAKSYKTNEANKVEKEFTQKDVDSAIEKSIVEKQADFEKKLELKDVEISELSKKLADSEKAASDKEDEKKKEDEKAKEDAAKKLLESEKALETEKKLSLEKQKFADEGNNGEKGNTEEEAAKAYSEGKLQFVRIGK
jgi:hypothetical protein